MNSHLEITDDQFEEQFSNESFPAQHFSHEAHIRLAWIHLKKYGLDKAISNLTNQIRNFANRNGAPDKYNVTITIAAIKAVRHFMLKSSTAEFESFIHENPRLVHSFKNLLDAHYSANGYTTNKAKTSYLESDLLPFD
ncbi:MAG: hypothetical protein RJQ09_12340 [Cyclobacteriaceae bacterium]